MTETVGIIQEMDQELREKFPEEYAEAGEASAEGEANVPAKYEETVLKKVDLSLLSEKLSEKFRPGLDSIRQDFGDEMIAVLSVERIANIIVAENFRIEEEKKSQEVVPSTTEESGPKDD